MSQTQSFECNEPDVVFENFGDDTIILNLQTGSYYSLNPVGMLYWELLSQSVPVSEVVAFAAEQFPALDRKVLDRDLETVVAEFRGQGLLRPSEMVRSIHEVNLEVTTSPEYVSPALSIYTDVAEMILLDPVHDVSESGWPAAAPEKATEVRAGK